MTESEVVTIDVDAAMYSVQAIQRAAHRFTATHFVELAQRDGVVTARLTARGSLRFPQLRAEFHNAVLDEQLRSQIGEEVRPIREMLVKAALQGATPKIRKRGSDPT